MVNNHHLGWKQKIRRLYDGETMDVESDGLFTYKLDQIWIRLVSLKKEK
jgi:hypothetical protein